MDTPMLMKNDWYFRIPGPPQAKLKGGPGDGAYSNIAIDMTKQWARCGVRSPIKTNESH